MPLPEKRSHRIALDDAAKLARNFRDAEAQDGAVGAFFKSSVPNQPLAASFFFRDAFDDLLSQQGCVGIRIYYARKDDRLFTLVLVGVDENGNDMTSGFLEDIGHDCPPDCSDFNRLNA